MCYSPVRYENKFKLFVKLACVKHITSVYSEPGSNSLLYSLSILNYLNLMFFKILNIAITKNIIIFNVLFIKIKF